MSREFIHIGIDETDRARLAHNLTILLANTYTLSLKTLKFHWNVTGPMFQSLHLLFEDQYDELELAVDMIAERIRSLGFPTAGTFAEFAELSLIKENPGVPSPGHMIAELCDGNESLIQTIRDIYPFAQLSKDFSTSDLLSKRLRSHEQAAWKLRSLLLRKSEAIEPLNEEFLPALQS